MAACPKLAESNLPVPRVTPFAAVSTWGRIYDMGDNWYLALDGDDIGRRLELHMLTENESELKKFSATFEEVLSRLMENILQDRDVVILLQGGDSILIGVPRAKIDMVVEKVRAAVYGSGFTFSGGYGSTMRESYLALKLAKATGKNRILAADVKEI